MKFDFVIGNPPYQEQASGEKISDASIYNFFMEEAYKVGKRVELITPARFLFDNGNTPTNWNKKMLNDVHFKVLKYEVDSKKVFINTDIKGGIAIHYRDMEKEFGAIEQFTPFQELNSILKKVKMHSEESIMDSIYNQNKFDLEKLYKDYPKLKKVISSDGNEKRLTSGCIKYDCFKDVRKSDKDIEIIGIDNNKRIKKYIEQKYIELEHENLFKYKVILPANNGSGAIGEVLSTPLIGEPLIGFTQSFISIGAFEHKSEAESTFKYIKTKFCRTMLGILKVTQNGKKPVWRFVPIQNFTSSSDIDWSKSIKEIDKQLYKKYKLSKEEIDFIEQHVKEMN